VVPPELRNGRFSRPLEEENNGKEKRLEKKNFKDIQKRQKIVAQKDRLGLRRASGPQRAEALLPTAKAKLKKQGEFAFI